MINTAEDIKEVIAKTLEKDADRLIREHLKEIESEMKKRSKEMIVRAMEECQIHVAQDYSTMQTVVKINFGDFRGDKYECMWR